MIAAPLPDEPLRTARARAAAGAWAEVRALLEREVGAALASAELAVLRGEALLRTGQTREARAWLAEAVPRLERLGDRAALRRGLNLAGAAAFELGELPAAEEHFGRALELGRMDGDELLVARATNNLGAIADLRGRREAALALYQLALPAYQRLGHPLGLAQSWHNMAISYRELGRADRADECERHAIEFARAAESPQLVAMAQTGRAELCLRRGDAPLAAAQAIRAAADFARLGDAAREADALRLAGTASLVTGDSTAALAMVERAVALADAHGSALIAAEAHRARAEVLVATGDRARARRDAETAAALFEKLGRSDDAEQLRSL